ncbi:hypothetical protein QN360_21080, partial [Glaciimonas sp. CA11.2]|uniref:hypothetical protein n=1 Tax=Glaciimonas sp. CA11.2 TaxID=3048601 RepID=UPI002B23D75C
HISTLASNFINNFEILLKRTFTTFFSISDSGSKAGKTTAQIPSLFQYSIILNPEKLEITMDSCASSHTAENTSTISILLEEAKAARTLCAANNTSKKPRHSRTLTK